MFYGGSNPPRPLPTSRIFSLTSHNMNNRITITLMHDILCSISLLYSPPGSWEIFMAVQHSRLQLHPEHHMSEPPKRCTARQWVCRIRTCSVLIHAQLTYSIHFIRRPNVVYSYVLKV